MKTVLITPSYVSSAERASYAEKSLSLLREAVGEKYSHIVVDDYPRIRPYPYTRFLSRLWIPDFRNMNRASQVYEGENIRLVRQWGNSSTRATMRALRIAEGQGADLVFLHLDDNAYISIFQDLFEKAIDAFRRRPKLKMVRLTDTPILSNDCTEEQGNRTELEIEDDVIRFENLELRPQRYDNYTLWTSPFHKDLAKGEYFPITMWFTLFRASFLHRLFEICTTTDSYASPLVDVERFYKDVDQWREVVDDLSGELGYINMQFGGLEMHQNKNWKELVNLPNHPVR
ncbi:inhibitor of KinA sporulation pathway (predicted exonuclease) [Salinibacter ruber]|uniref:hypothetical protein n=1 Tax=Salinibacter ruber TaxID=146919 RepID=UPI0021693B14|nr:hypothetical protein [Salinibacter ruber]MCS3657964.1 inhibitor of KinA sporulation pathway (predicted exonuclease) [Salinibacter ruber]MCS4169879.1 inhibitor of KinA sporulation pathway (predicted exonuclease) [Salinibacter ruber]